MTGNLMKNILLVMILCCAAIFAAAAKDEPAAADKIRGLEEQDKKLAAEMFKLRAELIKKDPALLKLHKQIIALHKELELKIDSKKEMRVLLSQAAEVSKQLEELKAPAVPEKSK
jgi:predicted RNase H-like nuclease (RuvC/YqgF family)